MGAEDTRSPFNVNPDFDDFDGSSIDDGDSRRKL